MNEQKTPISLQRIIADGQTARNLLNSSIVACSFIQNTPTNSSTVPLLETQASVSLSTGIPLLRLKKKRCHIRHAPGLYVKQRPPATPRNTSEKLITKERIHTLGGYCSVGSTRRDGSSTTTATEYLSLRANPSVGRESELSFFLKC